MFGTILLTAAALMHAYVFWRLSSIGVVRKFVSGWGLFGLGLVLWLLVVIGREYGHGRTGPLAVFLELAGMNWLVVVFLACTLLLAVDLITGFGLLFPRFAPGLRLLALIGCLVLSATALVQGLRPPVVEEYDLSIRELPENLDGMVIAAVSDLHVGSALGRDWLEARAAQIMEMKPDMVVLLGDMFEGHDSGLDNFLLALRELRAPLGVWAIKGNHEGYRGWEPVKDLLERAGIGILVNRWVQIQPGLVLSGVENLISDSKPERGGDPLNWSLGGRPPGATILLSHSPHRVADAARYGVDLMLSGHTHAGQVWPFNYFVRLRYQYMQGLYEVDGMKLIVSRGAGSWGPRMRLFKPGEILRIRLHRGQDAPAGGS